MNWHKLTFKTFITLQRGFDLPVSEMKDGEVPVLGSTGIIGFHNKAKANPPGVVTGRSGTIGVIQFTDKPYWPHNTSLWVKDFKSNHPKFVYYKMKTLNLNRFNGGASVPTLNRNNLDNIIVQIPDISIQEKIADILSSYDDLIDTNRRRIRLLEESAQLLFREWFVYFRFPGHEKVKIVDGVPEGWKKETIGKFFDTTSGGTPSRKHPEYFEGDINWVKTQELNENFIFETEEKITQDAVNKSSTKVFPKNTLLVSIYGNTNIGRTCILANPAATNQACVALFPKKEHYHYIYLQQYLQAIRSSLIGMSQGAAQTNISQETLRKVKILMPNEKVMYQFIERAESMYEQIKTLQLQNQKLTQAQDLLLPRLMSGAIEV